MSTLLVLIRRSKRSKPPSAVATAIADWSLIESLDARLSQAGRRALTSFLYRDIEPLQEVASHAPADCVSDLEDQIEAAQTQPEWHDASEGLASFNEAMEIVRRLPNADALRDDLARFQTELIDAALTGDPFRLEVG